MNTLARKTLSIDGQLTVVEYSVDAEGKAIADQNKYTSCFVIRDGHRVARHFIPKPVIDDGANCYVGGHWYKQPERH